MYLNRKTYKLEYCYCCLKDGRCLKDGCCQNCPTAAATEQPNVKAQLQTAAAAATELQIVKAQLRTATSDIVKLKAILLKTDHV